ncbi:hypothetical protein [Dentiradicibacter hellwigii]|uniref:Uncharacterized protein n=1 Tax=Dentiradicibacter hellwigii TaxID=3149053 RepID=A0ABV4UDF7_9RHOO
MKKQTKITLPTAGQKKPLVADTQPDMLLMETPARANVLASGLEEFILKTLKPASASAQEERPWPL